MKPFSASYNGYERDISSISLIADNRLWFHSVIQTGDLRESGAAESKPNCFYICR